MASKKEIEVVKGLNVERYMGRWYEIASFPSPFQPNNAVNTRATYTLNPDGTIKVLNETWSNGKRSSIGGIAYKADPKSIEAKFKLKFFVPPTVGDYWVLYIDESYHYALIGEPSRKSLFILCRQTRLNDEIYNLLVQKAVNEGYDVSKLRKTPQANPPPGDDDIPKDKKGI